MPETIQPPDKDSNIIAALSCLLGVLIALIIYFLKKEDRYVRFFALQAVVLDISFGVIFFCVYIVAAVFMFGGQIVAIGGGLAAAGTNNGGAAPLALAAMALPFLGFGCVGIVFLTYAVLKLYTAYKAYSGVVYRIPYIGAFVENHI
ncbi:Uncharacterised protein [Candidatus Burarchaeum australiense]|nr:Uncharacterised protein [Candidatus Burarchaeum australiense]